MALEKKRVLVVDDSIVIQRLVCARLGGDGFECKAVGSGQDALQQIGVFKPDVILLDVNMPVLNGYDTCKAIKNDSCISMIPLIFLTAAARTEDKVKGLDLGAIDYITKPFDTVELRARVRTAARSKFLLDLLEKKAQIDGLTGLYNRAYLDNRLEQELERSRRYHSRLALVMLDVDRFKRINDTFGHCFGDTVLAEVAEAARAAIRLSDTVARFGGEEFVVLLPEQDIAGATTFAQRLRADFAALKLRHNDTDVVVTASFGIAATEQLGECQPQELVDAADKCLYAAKENGRNRVYAWDGLAPLPCSSELELSCS